jgi:hypothetical protein
MKSTPVNAEQKRLDESGNGTPWKKWDVTVEYAKSAPEDVLIKITIFNRGAEDATLHVLPTFWFRNTWAGSPGADKPVLRQMTARKGMRIVAATHADLGERWLCVNDNKKREDNI